MRNRRVNNIKNIKDYIVPIITFLLIFTLIYIAFSSSNDDNVIDNSNINNVKTSESLEVNFWSIDTEVEIADKSNKKTSLKDLGLLNIWESIIVKSWDISFSIPNKADFKLNTNWKINYISSSEINLESSALWIESITGEKISTRYATINVWKNSIANIEQNEVSSTLYLLKWTAEVKTLAGISTFLSPWQKIKISNQDASKENLDMNLLKEDFDDYFKISDWYLKNNGSVINSTLWENNTETLTWTLSGSWDLEKENNNSNILWLLNFDNIYDEWSVNTEVTNLTWKFADDRISKITINGKKVVINSENRTFNLVWVNTSKKENDIAIKVYDTEDNLLWKYLYTLYYSAWKEVNNSNNFAKVNTEAYPVNGSDFIISIPTVKNWETLSSENTFYGTVKNPDIKSVTVNGYKLKTFNGKTFRYHAYERFWTLWDWVNNYEIKYYDADWKVILKKYVTINKKSKKIEKKEKSEKKISKEASIN